MSSNYHKWTQLVNFAACPDDPYGSTTTPIYQTATFALSQLNTSQAYDYTRSGNPTRTVVEKQVAELESGKFSFGFSSGMAALTALTGIVKANEHIIVADDLYGGTYRLIYQRLITHRQIQISVVDMTDVDQVARAIQANTRLILLETPSNPRQQIADIAKLAQLARTKNILLAVDNTFLSPWLQQPLTLGADVVIHSATKFLSGHGDVSGGFLVVNDQAVAAELKFIQNAEGSALAPFDAWLILRGLKTLGLRVERQQANALELVEFLQQNAMVKELFYPTLNPNSRAIQLAQASGGGSLICFTTGSKELSTQIVNQLKLFNLAVSFGGLHSSISLPNSMSHAAIAPHLRRIPDDLVRISVGIEDSRDLIQDLSSAFAT